MRRQPRMIFRLNHRVPAQLRAGAVACVSSPRIRLFQIKQRPLQLIKGLLPHTAVRLLHRDAGFCYQVPQISLGNRRQRLQ